MKMNFFDCVFMIVLMNLENRISDIATKVSLVQLGLDVLPNTKAILKKTENGYTNTLETALHSLNLLEPNEDASSVKMRFSTSSSDLWSLPWFDQEYFDSCKRIVCCEGTLILYTTDFSEIQELQEQLEHAKSMDED